MSNSTTMGVRMVRSLFWLILFAAAPIGVCAQVLKEPVPMTPEQEEMYQRAMDLSDRHMFDSAFVVYEEAIALNPAAYELLYELALAYRLDGKGDKAIETALRGAQYDTPIWREFYVMASEIMGEQKRWKESAEMLEAAHALHPDATGILLPLGKAYLEAGRSNDARPYLEQAVRADSSNIQAHLNLGIAYSRRRYLVPMILAYLRLMELDTKVSVSLEALQLVLGGTGWDVATQDTTPLQRLLGWRGWGKWANDSRPLSFVTAGVDQSYDEGIFTAASRCLQLSQLRRGGDGYPSNPEKFSVVMDQFVRALPAPGPASQGFAAEYYVRWLKSIRAAGHLKTFSYLLLRQVDDPSIRRWLHAHNDQVVAYQDWARDYVWGPYQ